MYYMVFIESYQFKYPRGRSFYDTYSNLVQLFQYKLKHLYNDLPRNLNPKSYNFIVLCGALFVTKKQYCTLGYEEITDVWTFSFLWILPFHALILLLLSNNEIWGKKTAHGLTVNVLGVVGVGENPADDFLYKFKHLHGDFTEIWILKCITFYDCVGRFKISFRNQI